MWRYVKIPLVIALLAFVLPWLSVSLLDQHLLDASGWELASGHVRSNLGDVSVKVSGADANYYVAAALALALVALVVSFLRRRFAAAVAILSLLAMALIWAGANQYSQARIGAAASKVGGIFGAIAAPAIHVDWQVGYWVAMIALALAAILAFLAIRDAS